MNTIFVLSGHCDSWYCYCDKHVIDFNMMKQVILDNKIHLDMVCYDSCYTSSLELVYNFTDVADYVMAHQLYVYGEGFNSRNLCTILSADITFKQKIYLLAYDYLLRSRVEKGSCSISIFKSSRFNEFVSQLMKHSNEMTKKISEAKNSFITDPCEEWLYYCKTGEETEDCNPIYCSNNLDLYNTIKHNEYLSDNDKKSLIDYFNKSIRHVHNGFPMDKRFYKKKKKYHGLNIIINPHKSDYGKYYAKLRFNKEFLRFSFDTTKIN